MLGFGIDFKLKEDGKIEQLKGHVKDLADKIRKADKETEKLSESNDKLGKSTNKLNDSLETQKKILGSLNIIKLLDIVAAFNAIILVVAVAKQKTIEFLKELISVGSKYEELHVRLNHFYGSVEQGNRVFKEASDFTKKFGGDIGKVSNSLKIMDTNAMKHQNLKTWKDQAVGTGQAIDQIVQVVAAAKKGDTSGLEAAFGITALKNGKQTILNFKDEFGNARHVVVNNGTEMEAVLLRISNIKYGGLAEELSNTLGGTIDRLGGRWEAFKEKLSNNSGLMVGTKETLEGVISMLDNISPEGFEAIDDAIGFIVEGIISMIQTAASFVDGFVSGWQTIQGWALSVVGTIRNALLGLSNAIRNYLVIPILNAKAKLAEFSAGITFGQASENLKKQAEGLKLNVMMQEYQVDLSKEQMKLNDKIVVQKKADFNETTKTTHAIVTQFKTKLQKAKELSKQSRVNAAERRKNNKDGNKETKENLSGIDKGLNKIGESGEVTQGSIDKLNEKIKKTGSGTKKAAGHMKDLAKNASKANKDMLKNDLEYFRTVKDFDSAEETAKKLYHERLVERGFSKQRMMEMEGAMAEELKEKYHDLYTQELNSQTNLMAGVDQYMNKLQERMTEYNEYTKGLLEKIESVLNKSFNEFFDGTSKKFLDLKELGRSVMMDVLSYIQQMITKMIIMKTMSMITGGIGGGGGGGFIDMFKNGAAFGKSGKVKEFSSGGTFTNNVYNQPTPFSFEGGQLGVMGEAGSEAIMPLSKKGGQLGVRVDGMSQGVQMSVIINNNSGTPVQANQTGPNELTIESIDQQLSQRVKQGKSETGRIMESKYKL